MLKHVKKKERKEKIAPYPKRKKKRDGAYKGVHTPSTKKNPHTCTSSSGFWLSKIWEAGMPSNPPYLQLHKNKPLEIGWGRKAQ